MKIRDSRSNYIQVDAARVHQQILADVPVHDVQLSHRHQVEAHGQNGRPGRVAQKHAAVVFSYVDELVMGAGVPDRGRVEF